MHQAHWITCVKPLDHMHQAHWTTRFTFPHALFLYDPFYYERDLLYITLVRATYPSRCACFDHVYVCRRGNQSITVFTKIKLLTLQPLKRTREFLWNCCSSTALDTCCRNCCSLFLTRRADIVVVPHSLTRVAEIVVVYFLIHGADIVVIFFLTRVANIIAYAQSLTHNAERWMFLDIIVGSMDVKCLPDR